MIMGRHAYSAVVTDDEKGVPVSYEDHHKVLAAIEKREPFVRVSRVGYYGATEGSVWINTSRVLRLEENNERGRF